MHLSRRLKCTIVITRCPSSIHRPSVVNFHIFDFFSETAEWNSTKLDRKQDLNIPLPSLCFSGRSEKQDGPPGIWMSETFSTSPLKPLNGIQRNLTGSEISTSSTKFVFYRSIGKTRWPPWSLISWDIFHFSSTKFVFSRPIGKTRWLPWPLIGRDIFDFSSEITEWNSTKLDRKQDLNILYQVCVFRANRKNKMATLASD